MIFYNSAEEAVIKALGVDKEESYLKQKKDAITIRSSAAGYLTYVASIGD